MIDFGIAKATNQRLTEKTPSTRLSTLGEELKKVARQRKVSPDLLRKLLRGDLDWIVMKSLEKDRAQRYTTASEFVADIERYLQGEPVYPEKTGSREVTVRYILDEASKNLDGKFRNSPLSEAAIRQTLGSTYRKLGDYPAAEMHLRRALEIRREQLGSEDPATLASLDSLGWLHWCAGRCEQAEPLLTEAFEARERVLGPQHPETLGSLIHLAWLESIAAGGTTLAEKAYQTARRVLGQEHPIALEAAGCLAMKCVAHLRHKEAGAIAPNAYEISRRVLGEEHEATLVLMNACTWLYERQQRLDVGVELGEKVYEIGLRTLGQTHFTTLHAMANLGALYTKQGRYEEADTILTRALSLARRHLGQSHSIAVCCALKLGILYRAQGRYDEHDPLLSELLEITRRTYGEQGVLTGYAKFGLKVRKKQLTALVEDKNASGDGEGAAAALTRLQEINKALEVDSERPMEQE